MKILRLLFLIAFLFLFCLCFCLLPAWFRRREGLKRWNFLISPLSPSLFSTADVEKGI